MKQHLRQFSRKSVRLFDRLQLMLRRRGRAQNLRACRLSSSHWLLLNMLVASAGRIAIAIRRRFQSRQLRALASINALQEQRSMPGHPAFSLPTQAILLLFLRLEVSFATRTHCKTEVRIQIERLDFKLGN
jgi:hypothetical protein